MATISKWEPFGVALDITATVASVTRTSASKYSVKFNVSWKTYWDGAETNFGMKASAGGASVVINEFGNYASSGSGTVTGTYDISGNGAATKSVNVAFQNYECDWQGNITSSKSNSISLSVNVPAWTSYTVKYNANGGSGAPGDQTKWKDQALTLSSTVPSRTGHTFKGWATSASGSVAYSAGGSYTANANVTLYAVWQAYTYTVSYNANGGSGAPGNQTKTYGVTLKLSTTIPTRTNYSFLGWATSASGSVKYAAGANYTANANITLYAVWKLDYLKPRISNLSVYRCDEDGTENEDGTYAKVSCNWSTDRDVTSILVAWAAKGDSGSATVAASSTSGNVDEVVGGALNVDSTYTFSVTVADSGGSFTVSTTLSGKSYPMDVTEDGKGIAFFKAAEQEGLDVNSDALIRGGLEVGDLASLQGGIYIPDWRNNELTPSVFGNHIMNMFFHQGGTGKWKTILDIHGWTEDYDTTQIALPADQLAGDRNLKFRCGARDSGWSPWYTLLDNVNFYGYIDALGGFRFNHTWVGLYNSWTDAHNNQNRKGWIGHDGKTDLTMTNEATGHIYLSAGGKLVMLHSTYFSSGGNDQHYLGLSANKWKAVYAVSGTIVTSDRNQKTNIKPIEQKYIDLFDRLQPVTFTFKGSEHDRVHVGFISQDIEEAMKELDISAEEFAAFCRDVKMEKVEVVDEATGEKSEKDVPVKDENGNPVYLYSLRYTEFIALNTRMIQENRKKIAEQQTEIDDLKERLARLEELLLKGDTNVTEN